MTLYIFISRHPILVIFPLSCVIFYSSISLNSFKYTLMFKNVHIFSSLFQMALVVLVLRRHILLFMVSASSNGGYVYELCPAVSAFV